MGKPKEVTVIVMHREMFRGDRDGEDIWDSWEATLALSGGVRL